MECVVQTQLGLMCIINVPGHLSNYTLFVTNRSVIVTPYNNHNRMALEWEMAGQYSAISPRHVFGTSVLEILPLPYKEGWDLKVLVRDILKTC